MAVNGGGGIAEKAYGGEAWRNQQRK